MQEVNSLKRSHSDEPYSRPGHGHGDRNLPIEGVDHYSLSQANARRQRHATARPSPTFCLPLIPQGSSFPAASTVTTSRYNSDVSDLLVPPFQSSADVYSYGGPAGLLDQGSLAAASLPSASYS